MARPTRISRYGRLRRGASAAAGFTYLGLLLTLAIITASLAAASGVWEIAQRRDKEAELLFVGNEFRRALASYAASAPPGSTQQFPASLDNLLKDERFPNVKRHLRKIFVDPMTNSTEWGLQRNPEGGILGVYSRSEKEPLKQANFKPADQAFEGKTKYTEWVFLPATRGAAAATRSVPAAGQPAQQQPGTLFGPAPGAQPAPASQPGAATQPGAVAQPGQTPSASPAQTALPGRTATQVPGQAPAPGQSAGQTPAQPGGETQAQSPGQFQFQSPFQSPSQTPAQAPPPPAVQTPGTPPAAPLPGRTPPAAAPQQPETQPPAEPPPEEPPPEQPDEEPVEPPPPMDEEPQ
jgi:type II secretory pathway pseudopilin PulG